MNQTLLYTLFGVGISVATVAYIIWGSPDRRRKKKTGNVIGLINTGNSCFLNAVLQSLAACKSMKLSVSDYCKRNPLFNRSDSLTLTLLHLLKLLNNEGECEVPPYSAANVIAALRNHRWIISHEEQDAHEMFQVLMSTVDEELSSKVSVLSLSDINRLTVDDDIKSDKILLSASSNKYDSPFRGLLASQLKCKKCSYKHPVHFDSFNSLSLSIPAERDLSLYDCLQHFITSELVHNVECVNCSKESKDKVKSTFVKQLTIGKLPECLCIHLQRTVWMNSGVPVKRYEHIKFPEYVYMGQYVHYKAAKLADNQSLSNQYLVGGSVNKSKLPSHPSLLAECKQHFSSSMGAGCDPKFKLMAVVVHLGNVFSGHFVTYRRGNVENSTITQNKWFLTSDTIVREVSLDEVLQSDAYMLLYERIASVKLPINLLSSDKEL